MHHIVIVLLFLWFLSWLNRSHGFFYFISLIYLYLVCILFVFLLGYLSGLGKIKKSVAFGFVQVHERYVMRLKRQLQFEERKQANQRRVIYNLV